MQRRVGKDHLYNALIQWQEAPLLLQAPREEVSLPVSLYISVIVNYMYSYEAKSTY